MSQETEEPGFAPEIQDGSSGLYCFLSVDRPCGPDCMAFVTTPHQSSKGELSSQQMHCTLLSSAERLGRHLTIIASTMHEEQKRKKVAEADRKRESSIPSSPPNPFSGKR